MLVEWLVIRRLYGRMVDTLLATWGLSLLISGGLVTVFGNTTTGLPNPLGAVAIGSYRVGGYGLFVIAAAIVLLGAVFLVLRCTRAGLVVRGAMQSASVVSALGYQPQRIYLYTFAAGAALSGLAGGILAPLTAITPMAGGQFIAKAFITVITGGASVIAGTTAASLLLGVTSKAVEVLSTPVAGEIALLLMAVVLLRLLPQGITGRYFRGAL
jgi:branched-chain amino acid transport system permease protein